LLFVPLAGEARMPELEPAVVIGYVVGGLRIFVDVGCLQDGKSRLSTSNGPVSGAGGLPARYVGDSVGSPLASLLTLRRINAQSNQTTAY
jgi:hypothetical protein